jgi:hypothetical protein
MQLSSGLHSIVVRMNLPSPGPVAADAIAVALEAAIRDAAAAAPAGVEAFAYARVALLGARLAIVPGDLRGPITAAASGSSTLITALGLDAAQPAWAANALLSGTLVPFPSFGGTPLGLTVTIGSVGPKTVSLASPLSLAGAAAALQAALAAADASPELAQAQSIVAGDRLLVAGGAPGTIVFGPASPDLTSVSALQLHATYGVRVRVNGAESFDDASVELPQ